MGKSVLLRGAAREPQGAWLSTAASHTRSGGHMKAAGPISSYSASSSAAKAKDAERASPERRALKGDIMMIVNDKTKKKGGITWAILKSAIFRLRYSPS